MHEIHGSRESTDCQAPQSPGARSSAEHSACSTLVARSASTLSAAARAMDMQIQERIVNRMELNVRAREESVKIMNHRFAERDLVKGELLRTRREHLERLSSTRREREARWSRKLHRSPLATDLFAESQRVEEYRVRDHTDRRKAAARSLSQIVRRADEDNGLGHLRAEKRLVLDHQRRLKALRDVEKTNARSAIFLHHRSRLQFEKRQAQLLDSTGSKAEAWTQRVSREQDACV
mmetsp:Transcript_37756/g.100449  ORF Transcript_37756/g.100449 Transcript_37756/m.100449 type:complete len:235 (-) Transcript_37756:11-715(-)